MLANNTPIQVHVPRRDYRSMYLPIDIMEAIRTQPSLFPIRNQPLGDCTYTEWHYNVEDKTIFLVVQGTKCAVFEALCSTYKNEDMVVGNMMQTASLLDKQTVDRYAEIYRIPTWKLPNSPGKRWLVGRIPEDMWYGDTVYNELDIKDRIAS